MANRAGALGRQAVQQLVVLLDACRVAVPVAHDIGAQKKTVGPALKKLDPVVQRGVDVYPLGAFLKEAVVVDHPRDIDPQVGVLGQQAVGDGGKPRHHHVARDTDVCPDDLAVAVVGQRALKLVQVKDLAHVRLGDVVVHQDRQALLGCIVIDGEKRGVVHMGRRPIGQRREVVVPAHELADAADGVGVKLHQAVNLVDGKAIVWVKAADKGQDAVAHLFGLAREVLKQQEIGARVVIARRGVA